MRFYRNQYLDITDNIDVLQGRRIIELDYFSKLTQRGCPLCRQPLQLADCTGEKIRFSQYILHQKTHRVAPACS
jgi:hypothetical protein